MMKRNLEAELHQSRMERDTLHATIERLTKERDEAISIVKDQAREGLHLAAENAKTREALIGIKRAADHRRREKDGERHEYYFHTADAALAPAEMEPKP